MADNGEYYAPTASTFEAAISSKDARYDFENEVHDDEVEGVKWLRIGSDGPQLYHHLQHKGSLGKRSIEAAVGVGGGGGDGMIVGLEKTAYVGDSVNQISISGFDDISPAGGTFLNLSSNIFSVSLHS